MNRVILIGRLTRDPEVKMTNTNLPYAQFTIAVDRNYKNENGVRPADFINCIAWRATADLIGRFFHKGTLIGIEGQIQTNSYDDPQTGMRRTSTNVLVEQVHFLEKKQDGANQNVNPFADMVSPQSYNNQGYNRPANNGYNNGYNNMNNYQNSYQQNNGYNNYPNNNQQKPEQKQENPFDDIDAKFDVSSDDLPF